MRCECENMVLYGVIPAFKAVSFALFFFKTMVRLENILADVVQQIDGLFL